MKRCPRADTSSTTLITAGGAEKQAENSCRQIASHLHLAEGTIKRHLSNTYHKMGVGSRGEAVRKALSEEWITITDITDEEEEA